jgi:hypothetical protein
MENNYFILIQHYPKSYFYLFIDEILNIIFGLSIQYYLVDLVVFTSYPFFPFIMNNGILIFFFKSN